MNFETENVDFVRLFLLKFAANEFSSLVFGAVIVQGKSQNYTTLIWRNEIELGKTFFA